VDSSQALAASYRYDPFGNTTSSSGTQASANVYRFSSKELHFNSGLYYYGYRFYDPNLQRWLNRDPLGDVGSLAVATFPEIGDSGLIESWDSPNLYRFVYNGSVIWVDAYGLYTWEEWLEILGSGLGGAGQGLAAAADGAIPFGNPLSGLYDPSDPNFQFSRGAGLVASCALSGAGALKGVGISTKIGLHGPHHTFGKLGRLPHIQVNWWRTGVKGSGGAVRVPVPPGTPGFPR
jgi:RHS repeat-associated protein